MVRHIETNDELNTRKNKHVLDNLTTYIENLKTQKTYLTTATCEIKTTYNVVTFKFSQL